MSSGDPQNCYVQYPYPLPTHYYGPPFTPGYYHFQPHQNFCPCCGQRVNHNQFGAGAPQYGQALGIAPQSLQGNLGSWQAIGFGSPIMGDQETAANPLNNKVGAQE